MEKLKVCLLNDSFPPAIDGVANTTVNYAKIINNGLGQASVVTPSYPNVEDNYDFNVYRYPSIDTTDLIGYRAGIPFNAKLMYQLVNEKFDIIHTHCPVMSTILARILRDNIKKPIIFTYHTKFDYDIRKAIDNKLIQDVAIKFLISNISSVDDVWVVSKGAGENLRSLGYKGEYTVMSNGVDFSKGKSDPQLIETVKEQYHIVTESNKPNFLFVGRMMWYKGIKIILDALAKAAAQGLDFNMIFVGKGADLDDIKAYAKKANIYDKCIFTSAITDRRKLKAIFSLSDLFLFPSVYDTNGIVVREAAATSLASVLIEGSCAAEDTINGRNCIWIKEDSDQLAEILIKNKDNIAYYHQLGDNACNDMYMSWQQAVEIAYQRYIDIIKLKQDKLNISKLDLSDNLIKLYSSTAKAINLVRTNYYSIKDLFEQDE
ncbi:MAG: glycosyltransferase [Erysipelotrichaceae bacterium]